MTPRLLAVIAILALSSPTLGQTTSGKSPRPVQIRAELSGYAVNLNVGESAAVRTFDLTRGRSNFGPVSATGIGGVLETPTLVLPDWCTGTVLFIPATGGELGFRFESTGELLQLTNVMDGSSGLCFDFTTNRYTGRARYSVVAGTGRFEGATGSATNVFKGYCPDGACASLSPFEFEVTIELEPWLFSKSTNT